MTAIEQFVQALSDIGVNASIALWKALKPIHDDWWTAYRAAGMPYGETDDGMYQWLDEQSQRHTARISAKYEAQRQWMVDDFKRQLAERRDTNG